VLSEVYELKAGGGARGFYVDGDRLIAHALTPGYETYRGLGWSGVIDYRLGEKPSRRSNSGAAGARPAVSSEPISSVRSRYG
jgi:hypothetical protein